MLGSLVCLQGVGLDNAAAARLHPHGVGIMACTDLGGASGGGEGGNGLGGGGLGKGGGGLHYRIRTIDGSTMAYIRAETSRGGACWVSRPGAASQGVWHLGGGGGRGDGGAGGRGTSQKNKDFLSLNVPFGWD